MTKYTVYLNRVASAAVKVEGEDPEDAIEKAYEQGMPTLCAQCSGWGGDQRLDLSDVWEVDSVDPDNA